MGTSWPIVELVPSSDPDRWFFRLVARNGKTADHSQTYAGGMWGAKRGAGRAHPGRPVFVIRDGKRVPA